MARGYWAFTAPTLLTGLVLTALHEQKEASVFLGAIITFDVLMIVTKLARIQRAATA